MKRRLIIVTLCVAGFLCFPEFVSAQKETASIKLTDGSKLNGVVIENKVSEYVKLILMDNIVVTLNYDDIEWIKGKSYSYHPMYVKDHGYFNYTQVGLLFLKADRYGSVNPDFTLHTVNGFRLNSRLRLGLGVGIDGYGESTALPIYISGRGDFTTSKVAPVANFNVGYSYMWLNSSRAEWGGLESISGGLYWEIGGGIKLNYSKFAMIISIAYKQQSADISYSNVFWWEINPAVFWGDPVGTAIEKRKFKNLALTIGFEF